MAVLSTGGEAGRFDWLDDQLCPVSQSCYKVSGTYSVVGPSERPCRAGTEGERGSILSRIWNSDEDGPSLNTATAAWGARSGEGVS